MSTEWAAKQLYELYELYQLYELYEMPNGSLYNYKLYL